MAKKYTSDQGRARRLGCGDAHRDLFLSQNHGLLLDGGLISAGALVNGKTITEVESQKLDRLDYFQLELPEHDVIIAEGMFCETLLDRDATPTDVSPYAPRLSSFSHPRVQLLKSRLRSAISPIVDVRTRVDIIRDKLEDRAELLHAA